MPKLPRRFPEGSKYVLEADGAIVRRYVELPNSQKNKSASAKGYAPRLYG